MDVSGKAYCLHLQVHNDGDCNNIRNIVTFLAKYTVSHLNSIYYEKLYIVVTLCRRHKQFFIIYHKMRLHT